MREHLYSPFEDGELLPCTETEATGEKSHGNRRLLHVLADCPGIKRTMSEGHFSHATFAMSGFIETANIFQT